MAVGFDAINFGLASAEKERLAAPEMLVEGYFDLDNTLQELLEGRSFLVLGYKGSGKSALAEHILLRSESDPHLFASEARLSDFPPEALSVIQKLGDDGEVRMPSSWTLVFLSYVYQSLVNDHGARVPDDFLRAVGGLRNAGLLPSRSLHEAVVLSTRSSKKLKFGSFAEWEAETTRGGLRLDLPIITQRLREALSGVVTQNRHVVIVDGIDEIRFSLEGIYAALAGLVNAADRLNDFFHRTGIPTKVLVLCQTDIFARLPGKNKNKLRQDASVTLDWYSQDAASRDSSLFALVNRKASVADPTIGDVVGRFFPSTVAGEDAYGFLLRQTRHRPRDVLRLMRHIQEVAGYETITTPVIETGLVHYARAYLLSELADELDGYLSGRDIQVGLGVLASHRRLCEQPFTLDDFYRAAGSRRRDSRSELFLTALFDAGGLGFESDDSHVVFKFATQYAFLDLEARFQLHPALRLALAPRASARN